MRLKALRPQVGAYGSIDAGGVVEIEDERQSDDLIKTGNWAKATEADLDAARKRQATFIEGGLNSPVGPQFAHVVEAAPAAILPSAGPGQEATRETAAVAPTDTAPTVTTDAVPAAQDDKAAASKPAPARGKPA